MLPWTLLKNIMFLPDMNELLVHVNGKQNNIFAMCCFVLQTLKHFYYIIKSTSSVLRHLLHSQLELPLAIKTMNHKNSGGSQITSL